jgi:hypothetical protein
MDAPKTLNMKHAIIHKFIEWVKSDELYGWDEFFTSDEADEEYPTYIEIDRPRFGGGEGIPIRIDDVIEILNGLKEKGATHVQMDWHCDHLEYEFYGLEVRKATEKEMEEESERLHEENKKEADKRIAAYEEEIEKLKKIKNTKP